MSEKVVYCQSLFGLPYAIKNGKISFINGVSKGKDKFINHYASMPVKRFCQRHFSVSYLKKVVGMPSHLRKALRKELEKEDRCDLPEEVLVE